MEETVSKSSFGRQQVIITLAICYSNIIGTMQTYCIMFMTFPTEFRCVEPKSGSNGTTSCEVSNGSHTQPCTRWEYEGPRSLISEWDLVCDRAWLVSMAKSVYMIGFLFAVISFGQLSDLIGRYRAMCIGYVLAVVSMFMTLLSSSYIMFLILYFIQAFGRQGLQICSFVLLTEFVGEKHRELVSMAYLMSWSLGMCLLTGIAWISPDWFWLQLAMSASFSTCAITIVLTSESPRWVLIKDNQQKQDKIEKECKETYRGNLDDFIEADIKTNVPEEGKDVTNVKSAETILDLFRTPQLRKKILIMYYTWPTSVFMYYAFLYNTNDLAGDHYLNFVLASVLDLPSYAMFYWAIRRFGRRPTLATFMMVGAASCIARIAAPQDVVWLQTTLWITGLTCATSSIGVLYLYSSELFPTVVRNVAVGSCSTMGRFGAILAPFVKEMGSAWGDWVPLLIYGSLCFIGFFLSLMLPETKGQHMKDNLQEDPLEKFEEKEIADGNDSKAQET